MGANIGFSASVAGTAGAEGNAATVSHDCVVADATMEEGAETVEEITDAAALGESDSPAACLHGPRHVT